MAKIARRRALVELPKAGPLCPAATVVHGVTPARCGVICGVMANDRAAEDGVGITAGQLAIAREGGDGDVFLTIEKDPGSVNRLCCGRGVPVIDDGGHYARDHYTYCPVWQAEKKRIEDAREQLKGGGLLKPVPEPESVSSGVSMATAGESGDPWERARRDLDVLAPPAGAPVDAYGPRPVKR